LQSVPGASSARSAGKATCGRTGMARSGPAPSVTSLCRAVTGQAGRRRTRGGRIPGSQVGSQRRQTSGDPRPRLAVIGTAKQLARPHPACSGDGTSVPSGQQFAGSNPARRAGQRHITILRLIVRSPAGSHRNGIPLQRPPPQVNRHRARRAADARKVGGSHGATPLVTAPGRPARWDPTHGGSPGGSRRA